MSEGPKCLWRSERPVNRQGQLAIGRCLFGRVEMVGVRFRIVEYARDS